MRLITGRMGIERTRVVLDRLRAALRAGDESVTLLVPTATLAQHWQNLLAREGFVVRGDLVRTLSHFVDRRVQDVPAVSETALYLLVERAVRAVDRPEFARVAGLPGFSVSLARTISEFSAAGCDSERLRANLPDAPLGPAFLAAYAELEGELARNRRALRARRLALAAARIEAEGLGGIRSIYLDGFEVLPEPELRVLAALDRHAEVTIVAEREPAFTPLACSVTREHLPEASRSEPELILFRARSVDAECSEIARRIRDEARAGRPFREIGIVVRPAAAYVPVLRTALERAGIPARFYFDSPLDRHPAVRFVCGAVDAMLSGWDHEQTLAALRLGPRFATSPAMDNFDFDVRLQIPNAGLGELKSLLVKDDGQPLSVEASRILHKLERISAIEEWLSFALKPAQWAERMAGLRSLFRPAQPPEALSHERALELRSQTAALDAFEDALRDAAEAFEPERNLSLREFWPAAKAALRLKPLRQRDGRRNVVHVLSAPEARQWELPVVFICGLVEKRFPQAPRQDPFFSDSARAQLNRAGIRVRTAAEFEREEKALFDSALAHASVKVVLSYPDTDSGSETNLPSIFLEDLNGRVREEETAAATGERRAIQGQPIGGIHRPQLLEVLRKKTEHVTPTGLETFLKCPFQYFASRILRLEDIPPLPSKRLDFMTQGDIVHQTLAEWYPRGGSVEEVFQEIFDAEAEKKRVPAGYHTERLRNQMLDDLRVFAADRQWSRGNFCSRIEEPFHLELGSVVVDGKIDRLDFRQDGAAWVIDYKYARKQSVKDKLQDENLLQPPLYLNAAETMFGFKAAGMFFVGLKADLAYAGWSREPVGPLRYEPLPEQWFETTRDRVLHAVEEIRAGRIDAAPADAASCNFCGFYDFCRRRAEQQVQMAEGA